MQGKWTIGKKLFTGVGVLIALLVASGASSLWTARSLNARLVNTGQKTAQRILLAERAQSEPLRMYIAEQMLLLARAGGDKALNATWQKKFDESKVEQQADLTKLEGLLELESGRQALAKFKQGAADFLKAHDDVMALVALDKHFEANQMSLEKVRPLMEANEASIAVVVDNQTKLLEADVAAAALAYRNANWTGVTLLSLGMMVAAFVGWSCTASTSTCAAPPRDLSRAPSRSSSAAAQVATSSQSLSQGATEQAASLEETSASMEEMASMTRKNAENSQQAAALMAEVDAQVDDSNAALTDMVASMTRDPGVERQGREDHQDDRRDRVPDQHPRAERRRRSGARRRGGHGLRGRRRRSAQPGAALGAGGARTPPALIEESIAKRRRKAASKVEQVAAAIAAITDSVGQVKGLVDEVSVASRQQSQGIDQVSQAIAQMEKVTQTTAATAEESAAASEELNAQAERRRWPSVYAARGDGRRRRRAARRRPPTRPRAAVRAAGGASRRVVTAAEAPRRRRGRTAEERFRSATPAPSGSSDGA